MERPWLRRLVVVASVLAVALVLVGGGLKNMTESCWMSGADRRFEYGKSDLRLRVWPPSLQCVAPDGTRLD